MQLIEIDNGEIDDAYQSFCKEFKLKDESINSVAEFLCYVNMNFKSVVMVQQFSIQLTGEAHRKVKLTNSEHSSTILRAYWVRRKSLHGMCRAAMLKPLYTAMIFAGFARLLFIEIKGLI